VLVVLVLVDSTGPLSPVRFELARSKNRKRPSHLAREWHETGVRPPRMVNVLDPDRDSNAGPAA